MSLILTIAGALLYFVVITDLIKTTLSMHAGGWVTSRITHWTWLLFLKLAGNNGRSRTLEHAGYVILVFILLSWIIFLWISFFLLLLSDSDSVINSSTQLPTDAWQKLYYAGFTLSTLGVGDFIASTNGWRMLTAWFGFTGLVLITLSISYFFSVLSGVVNQRQLGIVLASLGKSPQDMVLNGWDGISFHRLTAQASQVGSMLIKHSQNHMAYPVIHYFHTTTPGYTALLRIASLNEALIVLDRYVKEEIRPDEADIALLKSAVNNYLEVVKEIVKLPETVNPPARPRMARLVKADIINPSRENQLPDKEIEEQRKLLAGLIKQDGWSWADLDSGNR